MILCGKKCQSLSILTGLFLIFIGCFLQVYWESLLEIILKKKFIISPTSKTYDSWGKRKIPIFCKFYFFNWTNPTEFSYPSYKPRFEEIGPYVFIETLEKVDIQFHDNGTVSYKLKRFWHFDREASVGPLTDRITSANPVGAAIKYVTRYSFSMSTLTRLASPSSFRMVSVKTIDELLFKGYEDNLINLGRLSKMFFFEIAHIPYDKFGWWYPRNGSISEVYTIETGANGMDSFGELRLWNHERETPYYSGSCGKVYGSAGNFWPWNLRKSDNVVLFSADICRSIDMSFKEEVLYQGLIPAYKYESGPDFVNNSVNCPCNGECPPPGSFNATKCVQGAPVFVSYPHFHHADKYYTDAVIGMKPDKEKHIIYVVIDPKYGVPLELYAPAQINLLLEMPVKTGDWRREQKQKIYFPVLWVDQSFKMNVGDMKTMLLVLNLPRIGFFVSVALIVAGVALTLGYLVCRVAHRKKAKVLFREIGAMQTKDRKIVEPIEKHEIKFNYLKDSHL